MKFVLHIRRATTTAAINVKHLPLPVTRKSISGGQPLTSLNNLSNKCLICGNLPNGINYGVLSCKACAQCKFFLTFGNFSQTFFLFKFIYKIASIRIKYKNVNLKKIVTLHLKIVANVPNVALKSSNNSYTRPNLTLCYDKNS